MALRTTLLWIHALIGASWIGASACFVLAALAMAAGGEDRREFARRVAPVVNWVAAAAAVLMPLTGLVNLFIAGSMRRFHFSTQFKGVLSAKILLYLLMVLTLILEFRATGTLRLAYDPPASAQAAGQETAGIDRLVGLYAVTVLLGAVALALGLWLVGS